MGKIKLLVFIISIALYVLVYIIGVDAFADTDMIKRREIKSLIKRIENSITAKEKICVLGTTFIFSDVKIEDGKLVLFYDFDEKDTYCDEVLHGNKSE